MRSIFAATAILCGLLLGALTPAQQVILFSGPPSWFQNLVAQAGSTPSQACNFAQNQCWNGTGFVAAPQALTVSRASPETCADTNGSYTQVTNNVPCITNAGLGAWEARTNVNRTNNYTDPTNGAIVTDGIELVTNPLFGTVGSPSLTGWTDKSTGTGSSGTSAIGNQGNATVAGGAAGEGIIEQSFAVVAGTVYTLQFTVETNTLNSVRIGTASGLSDVFSTTNQTSGTARHSSFTPAASGTVFLQFRQTANTTATILAVSVQAMRPPLLIANNVWNAARGGNFYITDVGTANGVPYMRVRFVSNSTTLQTRFDCYWDTSTAITVTPGSTYTSSALLALGAGSLTNVTSVAVIELERNSAGSNVGVGSGTTDIKASLTPTLQRFTKSLTLGTSAASSGTTVQRTQSEVRISYTSGTAVDISLDFAMVQIELNAINATVASVDSIAAGGSGYTNGDVLTGAGYTGTAPTFTVTSNAGGVITGVSLTSAGSTSVQPNNPISVTGGTGTLATINVLYTDNSGSAFATPPILTTSGAVARALGARTLTTPPTFGAASSMLAQYTTAANVAAPGVGQVAIHADASGSTSNRLALFPYLLNVTSGRAVSSSTGGGSLGGSATMGATALNTAFRDALGFAVNDLVAIRNGAVTGTDNTADVPVGINGVGIGGTTPGAFPLNGVLASEAIWATQRLPNATLQGLNIQ